MTLMVSPLAVTSCIAHKHVSISCKAYWYHFQPEDSTSLGLKWGVGVRGGGGGGEGGEGSSKIAVMLLEKGDTAERLGLYCIRDRIVRRGTWCNLHLPCICLHHGIALTWSGGTPSCLER